MRMRSQGKLKVEQYLRFQYPAYNNMQLNGLGVDCKVSHQDVDVYADIAKEEMERCVLEYTI